MALNKTTQNAIDDSAITTEKIEDGAVTAGKLAAGDLSISKTLLLNAAPTISSLNTSQINPDSGATVTITGTGFISIPDVRFLNTSTGVRIQASTIGFTSSTTITAAFPSGQTPGTYKVLVENADGKGAISTSTITYSAAPSWSTAANLGSIEEGESVNIQLLAYDDDSTAVSSYSLVSGSLPSGVTLSGDSSVGALTGTAPAVDADTNYTFTIRATDDESQTSDREFTLTITNWTVANSLRFDDGSSDYLNRTPSSTTNRRTFTISFWIKSSTAGGTIFSTGDYGAGDGFFNVRLSSSGRLVLDDYDQGGNSYNNRWVTPSTTVFRDPSAWYHMVISVDSTQATLSDRVNFYLNGENIDSLFTDNASGTPSQNADFHINYNKVHQIGRDQNNTDYFDGYIAEFVIIDGQQLTPTSFGETDTDSGIWKPKSVSGLTFGTNGFYLPFTNSGSLGADSSGNSNDWTVNNLTAIDKTTDTPVNNHSTLNPLTNEDTDITLSQGNLNYTNSGSGDETVFASMGVSSGKWYFETKWTDTSNYMDIGVGSADEGDIGSPRADAEGTGYYMIQLRTASPGTRPFDNGSAGSGLGNSSVNDINMFAIDMDNNKFYAGKNGTWYSSGDPASGSNPLITMDDGFTTLIPIVCGKSNSAVSVNFGSPSYTISSGNSDANGYGNFEYAVPSGYFALNTKNLAEYG